METGVKSDAMWMQGTRRNTRSASNQEKEAKEKASSMEARQEANENFDLKKKEEVGRIVRGPNNEVIEYTTANDISYRVFDSAYIDTERSDNPYFIATIQELKVSKKDNAVAVVKWYYRPSEVPDSVYQMLVKDRLEGIDDATERETVLNGENRNRELFACDDELTDVFPVSRLRGKCSILHLKNYKNVLDHEIKPDTFFYVLGYNPDTRRLTSTQGEVRVGPSHQWNASTRGIFQKASLPDLLPPSERVYTQEYEEKTWSPNVNDCDLVMFLRSARSMAAFAGMCDGGSPEEGCVIASRDDTTINALNVLFQSKGDARLALQVLVKSPLPLTIERKWTEDQVKRFQKGLRQNGKNFYKIRKDLLPSMRTADLVEFYYLWKKVQENLMIQPQSKSRRQVSLKKISKTLPTVETGGESSSEIESETDEDVGRGKICHRCQTTTSDDWCLHGNDGLSLCVGCLVLFKKYGHHKHVDVNFDSSLSFEEMEEESPIYPMFMDPVSEVPPPFMFKPIKEKHSDEGHPKSAKRQWKMDDGDTTEMKRIKPEVKTEDVKVEPLWESRETAEKVIKPDLETKDSNFQPNKPHPPIHPHDVAIINTAPVVNKVELGEEGFTAPNIPCNDQSDNIGDAAPIQAEDRQTRCPTLDRAPQLPSSIPPSDPASPHTSSGYIVPQPVESLKPPESNKIEADFKIDRPVPTPLFVPNPTVVPSSPMDHLPPPDGHHFHSDGAMGQALLPSNSRDPTQSPNFHKTLSKSSSFPTQSTSDQSFNVDQDSEVEDILPPQHHITIPAGESLPPSFIHNCEKKSPASPKTSLFGKKTRFAHHPSSSCSRTDYTWIAPKEIKISPKPVKAIDPPSSGFQHPKPPQHRPPLEKEKEHPRHVKAPEPMSRREENAVQTPRPSSMHVVPRSSPSHYEPHRSTPSHSSYAALGPGTPALRTLRQYAGTYDAQRDGVGGMQLYPYPQHGNRDLRERDLREREMRERLQKPGLENLKLLEALEPHLAASHPGMPHASLMQGISPQAMEQIRQTFPPGAMVGMQAASPQIGYPQALHPEFSAQHAANERLSNERLAYEQFRMDMLHNHQHHIHSHSHLHLHQPNGPPGAPLNVVHPPAEPVLHPYAVMALQAQTQQAFAQGLDPLHAVTNQMLNLQGFRGPAPIMANPGIPMPQPGIPGRPIDPLQQYLSATQHLQAVAHEQHLMEQRVMQEEYMRVMALGGHKP